MDLESNDSSSVRTDPSLAEAETAYREVEFQGCGVPSAFADPGAFEGPDEADGAVEEDRLTDLPKLPLQMRSSGLRVRSCLFGGLTCISLVLTVVTCMSSCHGGHMVHHLQIPVQALFEAVRVPCRCATVRSNYPARSWLAGRGH